MLYSACCGLSRVPLVHTGHRHCSFFFLLFQQNGSADRCAELSATVVLVLQSAPDPAPLHLHLLRSTGWRRDSASSARPDSCCSPTNSARKKQNTQTAELESRMIQFWHDRIPPGPSWSRTGTRTTPLRSLNIVPRTPPPLLLLLPPAVSGTQAGSAESSRNHLQQPLCHAEASW